MIYGIRTYAIWNQLIVPNFASIDTHSSVLAL